MSKAAESNVLVDVCGRGGGGGDGGGGKLCNVGGFLLFKIDDGRN